ncbi:MAG: DNA translocase FtsK 4TM domain-containing protein [Acidobacteria bacterium]|nr:DNA translocase FtsK 4TM domain-containing protein [Acidobacteriota bacterium]
MKFFSRVFTPGANRRLNELTGFLLFVAAGLLFLALVSYSPLDPSPNTAGFGPSHPLHNWIGLFGAAVADLLLQSFGVMALLIPVPLGFLAVRWFRSRKVQEPAAKTAGVVLLALFTAGLLGVQPLRMRWLHVIPVEGVLGRVLADVLIRFLNVAGAYIVSIAVIAVALYLSTAFSFGQLETWFRTRFAFVIAIVERFRDWRERARRRREQKRAEKARKAIKPVIAAPSPSPSPAPGLSPALEAMPIEPGPRAALEPQPPVRMGTPWEEPEPAAPVEPAAPMIAQRADSQKKPRTTLPKLAGSFKLPPSSLLHRPDEQQTIQEDELKHTAAALTAKFAEFDVRGAVSQINPGPVVTTFEFKPEAGIKYSRITGLSEDLCLGLRAESILIERMPGKATIGIQVPNRERETIWLREVIESHEFLGGRSRLTLAMGKDINGRIVTSDLAAMPHLLIAGSTGSGKSVAINAMIMSVLYKATPAQVRLILVDPKRLELGVYEGVPHLYVPIITEPRLASNALRNAVREMERRLKLLAARGVRNIDQYNRLFEDGGTPSLFTEPGAEADEQPIPNIVIIIDELADLMMLDGNNVEESITRLAQMARAVGIHLVLATQRPSVDVITGLIKANFPARVSFRVATKVDSRTILDANGAEALLGRGDMLYLPSGSARVVRLHAPFVTEKEIAGVVEFWRSQAAAEYEQTFLEAPREEEEGTLDPETGEALGGEHDELFEDAVRLVLEFGKASTSLLQRRLRIGYGRAAHLIDLMERDGIVGPADGPKPREILKSPDWLREVDQSLR